MMVASSARLSLALGGSRLGNRPTLSCLIAGTLLGSGALGDRGICLAF